MQHGKPRIITTKESVEHVLSSRFYDGKAVYHPGRTDEEVRERTHEVPEEVSDTHRRELAREVFHEVRFRGHELT